MTNEITFHNGTEIQPMSADRRTENLEAPLSSLSANTQAQIASTWKLYSGWCALANIDVWQLDVVRAIGFFTAYPDRPPSGRGCVTYELC